MFWYQMLKHIRLSMIREIQILFGFKYVYIFKIMTEKKTNKI